MSIVQLSLADDGTLVKKEITREQIISVWQKWFSLSEEERAKILAAEDSESA